MAEFLEERLDPCIRIGALAEDAYAVEVTRTANDSRYASLRHGKPYREFDISYIKPQSDLAAAVKGLYDRSYGGFAGFRVKCWDDFTTANDGISAPSMTDCALTLVSIGVYQLVKEYGRDKPGLASVGRPKRTLYKPVAGTVLVSVAGQALPAAQWSVDVTTGRVALAANKSRSITAISKATQAVIEVGSNTFSIGESVAIDLVTGMVEINGLRALVSAKPTSTSIQVAINTALFSDYVSGGTVQTQPLAGEAVAGGCEFDMPCAFDSRFSVTALDGRNRSVDGLRLVELLNP